MNKPMGTTVGSHRCSNLKLRSEKLLFYKMFSVWPKVPYAIHMAVPPGHIKAACDILASTWGPDNTVPWIPCHLVLGQRADTGHCDTGKSFLLAEDIWTDNSKT